MKKVTLIAVSVLTIGSAFIIGCAKDSAGNLTGGLTPSAQTAIATTARGLLLAAQTYQAIGAPGLPAKDQATFTQIYNGLSSAAVQLQGQVGQPANPVIVNTGTPAVDAAIVKVVTPGATVTQADVSKVNAAAALVK